MAHADSLNLPLCFENMFPAYHLFYEPVPFEDLFKEFPGMKMTLDTGHANIGDPEQTRLAQFVSRLGPHIGHVHVSDNFGKEMIIWPWEKEPLIFLPWCHPLYRPDMMTPSHLRCFRRIPVI